MPRAATRTPRPDEGRACPRSRAATAAMIAQASSPITVLSLMGADKPTAAATRWSAPIQRTGPRASGRPPVTSAVASAAGERTSSACQAGSATAATWPRRGTPGAWRSPSESTSRPCASIATRSLLGCGPRRREPLGAVGDRAQTAPPCWRRCALVGAGGGGSGLAALADALGGLGGGRAGRQGLAGPQGHVAGVKGHGRTGPAVVHRDSRHVRVVINLRNVTLEVVRLTHVGVVAGGLARIVTVVVALRLAGRRDRGQRA